MKKIIKILLYTVLVLLVLIIITPVFFKGKVITIAKEELNKNLNAKVEFEDIKLSLIRNFPNLYVALEDLAVVGKGGFKGDTLVAFKSFSVKADLISAIKMENVKVKAIVLERPVLNGVILSDGTASWDITKPSTDTLDVEDEKPEEEKEEEEKTFNVQLKRFEIIDAEVIYDDQKTDMFAAINGLDFLLKGDMSKDLTSLDLSTTIQAIDFKMDGIRYLKKANFGFKAKITADMKRSLYSINENEISINDLVLGVNGNVKMPEDNIETHLKFETKKTDFKTLLSLVPAVYLKDFQDVKTSGKLALKGYVDGIYSDETMPNIGLDLLVQDAMFNYPDLPKSADNINIDLNVDYNGIDNDKTKVNLKKFHVEMGGNPVDMKMIVQTPESDPRIDGNITANIDLASLSDVVPLENTKLTGHFESDIDLGGYLSAIENEQYEDFKADGKLSLKNFLYESEELPDQVKINKVLMFFSPKYVKLDAFDAVIGKNDIRMNGNLENFIAYIFSDGIVKGNLNLKSSYLNLNDLMEEEESEGIETVKVEEETETEESEMSVVEVPENIDFTLESQISSLYYDKLEINDVLGIIIVKNKKVILDNLNMDLLKGSMVMNGAYNTQDIANPSVDFNLEINGFDIPSAFDAFNTIQKLAPIAKNCEGRFSTDLTLRTNLDQNMQPVYESMQGKGSLSSDQVVIKESKTFKKIGDVLKNDKFKDMKINDLDIRYEIKDGRIYLEPFETSYNNIDMKIWGDQGLDQTMNYTMNMKIPRKQLGSQANNMISGLLDKAGNKGISVGNLEMIDVDLIVTGTVSEPQVRVKFGDAETITQSVKQQAKQKVEQEVEKVKEDVKAEARKKADKIIKQAEKQADRIRAEARKAADAVRSEADKQADKLVDEAKNPIAKRLAKESAKKIRSEADKKADAIEREADKKANKVINNAKKQADDLLK